VESEELFRTPGIVPACKPVAALRRHVAAVPEALPLAASGGRAAPERTTALLSSRAFLAAAARAWRAGRCDYTRHKKQTAAASSRACSS